MRQSTLDNGLRVVTEAVPHARSLAIGAVVNCGSRHEEPAESGLAHLCEHMLFHGTSTRSAIEIGRHIDLAGGSIGAFTTRDYTCYHACVLADYRYFILDLLGDLFLNPAFPEEAVEREKQAVQHEIAMGRDRPSQLVHERMKQSAWPGHPLGRPVAGSPGSVERLSRAGLIDFFGRHYRPGNIVIAAAGQLDHDDFTAQVHDAFWRLTGAAPKNESGPPRFTAGFKVVELPSSQSYFSLGFPAGPFGHPDRIATHLLAHVLGGGLSSRLYRALREDAGWVYDIEADYQAYRDAGALTIEGSTAPELLPRVFATALREFADLVAGRRPTDAGELARARTHLLSRHHLGSEDMYTRMSRLATQELYLGHPVPATEVADQIQSLTGDQLACDAARFAASLHLLNTVIGGPALEADAIHEMASSADELFEQVKSTGEVSCH
ncbi:MAG: insulinase family protein [Acidobacteria bacterium]|nr:insulinase family protein [Acidobacteriota bacterium]